MLFSLLKPKVHIRGERGFLPRTTQWALLKQINLLASGLEGTSISGVI